MSSAPRASAVTPRTLSAVEGFVCGALAGCTALTLSSPPGVAQLCVQLQGELGKPGGSQKVYMNSTSIIDVLAKTWRNEGFRSLQRGLGVTYTYQILFSGARLGFYEPSRSVINRIIGRPESDRLPLTSIGAGISSGTIGGIIANPFFIIKTRMQASSHASSFDTLSALLRAEGLRGLARGMNTAIVRSAMTASAQLPIYIGTKDQLATHGILPANSVWTFLTSSVISAVCMCIITFPIDTALTRVSEQPTMRLPNGRLRGTIYKNPIDYLWKTFKTGGVLGWYKGLTTHFRRIGPPAIISPFAWDIFFNLYLEFERKREL